ncbi:MAG TPA: DUF445 domain-containing protein [Burkholderiaceae bacterium]|jgi:uncharacterized membrane-anchored protein YjiN (DUF445 family)
MDEQAQQVQLIRIRRIATGLLVLMTIIFVITKFLEPRYPYLAFIRAFTEAAMIGALADWFAVTALFKQPFGLPIPHTAIIQRNKDRIGEGIANFLENNFMTREVMTEEFRQIDFSGSAVTWLDRPENSRALTKQIVSGIPAVLRMTEDNDVSDFMQQRLKEGLANVRFAPFLAEMLSVLVADQMHQELFDHLVEMVATALERNRPYIRQRVHDRSPIWIPKAVDEMFVQKLVSEVQMVLSEMQDENSEWRDRFQQAVENLIENLRNDPQYEEKIASVVHATLNHPLFREYTTRVWNDVKDRLLADADSEDSVAIARLDQIIRAFSHALEQNTAVRDKLNNWIQSFAIETVVQRRGFIAGLVERVIQRWDGDTLARKFEIYIGKDLQYIRINGTLVGGLVGLLLYVFSLFL